MPRNESMDNTCQAMYRTLVTQNGLQAEHVDISQSVLYTSIMGLLLVTDKERELQLGSGQIGLCNVGNTCFLNAIVQCLSHTRGLRDYCLMKAYLHDKYSNQEPVLMNDFSEVLAGLWERDGEETTVNPGKFYHMFKEAVPHFIGYSQQDAQEFLRFLLDRLHTEINRRPSQCPAVLAIKEPKYSRFRISDEAFAMWQKHLDRDDSKIVDLFSGQLRSSLNCSVCSHYSNTFDVFCDLSLPIPKKCGQIVTLKECLDLFSQEEKLDKENSPMCERCNRHTESTKRLTIQRFPRILVIHLNRFTMSRYSVCKSSVSVSFPLTGLDLGPFGPVDCGPVLYDLYAVCNHSGTVNMGHYTAVCREEEGWCCYNDSCVTAIQEKKLQSNQAYILFYELKSCSITRK
ncbi:ubiquitin carboxyl-terminal hydrolase 21 [Paramisgurnus dabryanus]|uniref:ubiquitin carboxyl-terminal hydrolase 21 n=1 Tax=Paramisgurnus dabryanus TaxID=90735 RepID=UPI0031F441AF